MSEARGVPGAPPASLQPGGPDGGSALVSVVIASYDMAAYLPLAVRSALAQTYPNVEVLVIDDGSNDDTAAAIAPLQADARVRYYRQANAGQAVAKNRGVRLARGEYMAFLDADDFWAPDKLALQMPLFGRPEVGVVYSRLWYVDEAGRVLRASSNALFRGRVSAPLFIRNFIGFGTSIVRKACFEQTGGFNETIGMGIDYDLWLRLSTRWAFDYIDRPLLYYRTWPGQMSHDVTRRYLNGIETMRRFLREHPGAVDQATQAEGWAHTYVGFGHCVREAAQPRAGAGLGWFLRALRHKATYLPAWRGLVACMLRI